MTISANLQPVLSAIYCTFHFLIFITTGLLNYAYEKLRLAVIICRKFRFVCNEKVKCLSIVLEKKSSSLKKPFWNRNFLANFL